MDIRWSPVVSPALRHAVSLYRLQLLDAAHGFCLADVTWNWPAVTQPEGVAALVQASRQLGTELGAGELLRLVMELPQAAGGGEDGGDEPALPPRTIQLETVIMQYATIIVVLYHVLTPAAASVGDATVDTAIAAFLHMVGMAYMSRWGDAADAAAASAAGTRDSAPRIAAFRESNTAAVTAMVVQAANQVFGVPVAASSASGVLPPSGDAFSMGSSPSSGLAAFSGASPPAVARPPLAVGSPEANGCIAPPSSCVDATAGATQHAPLAAPSAMTAAVPTASSVTSPSAPITVGPGSAS